MTREQIKESINSKNELIKHLKDEILELRRQDILICDDTQWFEEKMEAVTIRVNRKKVTRDQLLGKIYWNESFKDEDDPDNPITITRCNIVRIDGQWVEWLSEKFNQEKKDNGIY